MRRRLLGLSAILTLGLAAACGSSSSGTGGGTTTAGTGGTGTGGTGTGGTNTGGTNTGGTTTGGAVWTAIPLLDDSTNSVSYAGVATVTGIHFDDKNNGAVTMLGDSGEAGAIQHLNGPKTIDKIAFAGKGACGGQDADFIQLTVTPLGLLANTRFPCADHVFTSADKGSTWKVTQLDPDGTPNSDQVYIGADSSGAWHLMDSIGNVWRSQMAPSATTTWERTWQPGYNTWGGQDPNSDPLPADDCQSAFPGTYYAFDPQQAFWASPDGKTMIYGDGDASGVGICRSTDGGLEFKPVSFPNPPAGASGFPYVILFTTATHGIAAYGSELGGDANSYVYVTDDAGATWTAATLPSTALQKVSLTGGFAAPSGNAIWLVGRGGTSDTKPVLLKSTDAGKTWKDISLTIGQALGSLTTWELHAGFALDDKNIWVGGNGGGLFYSASGGE